MIFANIAKPAVALLFAVAIVPPVTAQQATVGPAVPPAPPSVWTVSANEARGSVEIAATAQDGKVRFTGGCSKSPEPGFAGAFSGYQEGGLRTDGQEERVAFYVRGAEWQELYSVRLRYSAARNSWEIAKPLPPVFLNSFSRGGTLAVVNSRNEEVFVFDLTGSTAAVRTMRAVCGIPVGRI